MGRVECMEGEKPWGRLPIPWVRALGETFFPIHHPAVHGDNGKFLGKENPEQKLAEESGFRASLSLPISLQFSVEAYKGVCWFWPQTLSL